MARIRTIKPEFWTDDLIGSLSREQRLLFIASWNLADDEGLLRWSAPFLKGAVFPFDDDISVKAVDTMMTALVSAGVLFSYVGGRSQQALAYIVNFHKHQKINRPSPSRLPPPPVSDPTVRGMYAARDGHVCHLCDGATDKAFDQKTQGDFEPSPDHVTPVSQGGTDYPSNIRNAHVTCNKGRGNRTVESYRALVVNGQTVAQKRHPDRFTDGLSEYSRQEREVEQEVEWIGEQREKGATPSADAAPPSRPKRASKKNPQVEAGINPDTPEGAAADYWNGMAEDLGLAQVRHMTATRREKVLARISELGGMVNFAMVLDQIPKSPFLQGKNDRGWRVDFDWVLEPRNLVKISEGKFENGHA